MDQSKKEFQVRPIAKLSRTPASEQVHPQLELLQRSLKATQEDHSHEINFLESQLAEIRGRKDSLRQDIYRKKV
jgi:hypothetical protein